MKIVPALTIIAVLTALSSPASAAKKKKHHKAHHAPAAEPQADTATDESNAPPPASEHEEAPAAPAHKPEKSTDTSTDEQKSMDFNFFPDSAGGSSESGGLQLTPEALELKHEGETRRWMLTTHQTLGIATWILMAATVTIGQLNYNQLYGGGGGSNKWQNPHEYLVAATTAAFAATGAFALFAPSPYKKPLRFDTGLVHRIAVSGATLGMLTEVFLGWWTTHQANAGNPNNLHTMARTHQIVGWSTFGFLTIAAGVWVF